MKDYELAYKIAKMHDQDQSCIITSKDNVINLLCLSNKSISLILDVNTNELLEINPCVLIEDIVDFAYKMNVTNNYKEINDVVVTNIEQMVVDKIENKIVTIEINSKTYNLPDYIFGSVKQFDILDQFLQVKNVETNTKKEQLKNRLEQLKRR